MKSNRIIIIYSFVICLILTFVGLVSARNTSQLLSSLIFLPILFYFGTRLFAPTKPKKKIHRERKIDNPQAIIPTGQETIHVADNDKRLFLKLIGSAGFSLLLMALFTKKAQAAFFGSVPGPGTVAIKDSHGNQIDPAEKNPTDGYEVAELDDSGSPAYYGFLKDSGAWYIIQDTAGAYRYFKGSTDFATNWTNRDDLEYGYFDAIFGG